MPPPALLRFHCRGGWGSGKTVADRKYRLLNIRKVEGSTPCRCQVDSAQIRQSRPNSRIGSPFQVLVKLYVVLSSLGSVVSDCRVGSAPGCILDLRSNSEEPGSKSTQEINLSILLAVPLPGQKVCRFLVWNPNHSAAHGAFAKRFLLNYHGANFIHCNRNIEKQFQGERTPVSAKWTPTPRQGLQITYSVGIRPYSLPALEREGNPQQLVSSPSVD